MTNNADGYEVILSPKSLRQQVHIRLQLQTKQAPSTLEMKLLGLFKKHDEWYLGEAVDEESPLSYSRIRVGAELIIGAQTVCIPIIKLDTGKPGAMLLSHLETVLVIGRMNVGWRYTLQPQVLELGLLINDLAIRNYAYGPYAIHQVESARKAYRDSHHHQDE